MTKIHDLLGQAVMYTLSKQDCDQIINLRRSAGLGTKRGNEPRPGDVLPAVIVKTNDTMLGNSVGLEPHVNLQVMLDGDDTYWATSRLRFDPERHDSEQGHWFDA